MVFKAQEDLRLKDVSQTSPSQWEPAFVPKWENLSAKSRATLRWEEEVISELLTQRRTINGKTVSTGNHFITKMPNMLVSWMDWFFSICCKTFQKLNSELGRGFFLRDEIYLKNCHFSINLSIPFADVIYGWPQTYLSAFNFELLSASNFCTKL